jgi:cell division control protein 6
MQEGRQNKPQRLSLICILRSLGSITHLDESTRSTLQSNIINLKKYSKEQLTDILNDRVAVAFKPSTVPEDTVDLTAEIAYSENGNARFGIELLWRAGKYSDAEDLSSVTPECVRQAFSSIIATVRKSDLASLNFHAKLFLLGMTRILKESQKANASLVEAEKAYAIVCEEFSVRPNSHTQLWKYLQDLSTTGILKTEVPGTGSRGRSTLIYFQVSTDELGNELKTVLEKGGA